MQRGLWRENTGAGSTVGDPVTADPKDGDVLTYTLWDVGGTTQTGVSANFDIDGATGQIMTKVKSALDAEGEDTITDDDDNTYVEYTVVVRATDPAGIPGASDAVTANSAVVTVVIRVTDVNDVPVVTGTATPTFAESTGEITTALGTYMAADEDGDTTTLSLGGADGSKFEIDQDDGELRFKKKPDYEKPTDADMDNVYEVTVQASDGKLTGMLKVKVTVNNEEEAGTVTLDKATPVVGIPVTATLKDADGGISKLTWAWTISGADAGNGQGVTATPDGEVATSDTYTPKAGDVGGTLTVTASYFDGQNAPSDITSNMRGKTAPVTSVVVERDTRNKAPVFGDEDPDTSGVQNSAATRKVEEGTTGNVGAPVAATDSKAAGTPEALQYSLSGTDMSSFSVDNNSGQIAVGSGTKLDYEGKRTYMVTVTATDPLGTSSSIPVTIEVTNVDEAPEIMRAPDANVAPEFADSEDGARSVAEDTAAGEDIGNPVAASDANRDALTYALSGTDAVSFDIDMGSGQLMTLAALDYETKATYSVTVTASDSGGLSDSIDVTITVTNVDEGFEVSGPAAVDYAENGTAAVATYSATDPESATITWSLEGDDAADFEISAGGVLTFGSPPDYENPADADSDNVYEVTVKASDGTNEDTLDVIITMTDVDEDVAPADPLKDKYDANDNDEIERSEVFAAINDYLDGGAGAPTRADVFKLIELYLGD